MAFLPWQQVSAPNNSTAASFMKLAMQGVESAGKSFSDAAQGASDIYKNKADSAREKANALLTGQVLNAPDSEAASMLMQDALAASGDSGLFNTRSLTNAQDARKTRIDTETAEVDLKYKQDTLENRVTLKGQEVKTNDQLIEQNERNLANMEVTDVVNAMESPLRNFYLSTGALPSTEEMESMLNEYFKSNNIDPNSERGRLIQTKFASEAQKKAMSVALQIDGLTADKATAQAEKIAAGTPDLSSTATVDVLNKTGNPAQVVKKAISDMGAVSESGGGETKWDANTTGASTPQEWESKMLMLAGKHKIPAGQLQMLLSMGFRDVDDEDGFKDAAVAAQEQYIKNKNFETFQNETNKQLAEVNKDLYKKEITFKMLLQQDGNLNPKQVAERKNEIDELKKAQEILKISLEENELGRWRDPHEVKVAKENLAKEGIIGVAKDYIDSVPKLALGSPAYLVGDFINKAINGPDPDAVKGSELLTDSEAHGRWKEGKVKPSEVRLFASQIANDPELNEKYTNWYNGNIVQASNGDKKAINKLSLAANPSIEAFMRHHAILNEADDAAREAELAVLNTDRIANELAQKALADQGKSPVEPVNLTGSGRANASNTNTNTSKKGPNKDGVYISEWSNPNRNPDPAGSTTVKIPQGAAFLVPSVWPVVNDYVQENFGRSLTSPEWQSIQYELAKSEGNENMFNNTTSREIEIPNELLERLFSGQN